MTFVLFEFLKKSRNPLLQSTSLICESNAPSFSHFSTKIFSRIRVQILLRYSKDQFFVISRYRTISSGHERINNHANCHIMYVFTHPRGGMKYPNSGNIDENREVWLVNLFSPLSRDLSRLSGTVGNNSRGNHWISDLSYASRS